MPRYQIGNTQGIVERTRPFCSLCYLHNTNIESLIYSIYEISELILVAKHHRHLLLKLYKQICGTIYQPNHAADKAEHLEEVGCHVGGAGVQYTNLLDGYVSFCLVLTVEVYEKMQHHRSFWVWI